MTVPSAARFGIGLEVEHLALQLDRLEQLVEVGPLQGRNLDLERIAAHALDLHVVMQQFRAHTLGLGARFVDLVDRHDHRHLGGLGVVDRLDGLRHDAIVRRHDEHDDVRDLGAARPHGRERGMAGRVDEGHGAAVRRRHLVGPDMLGDAAGFARHDVRLPDGIEERRLAVIDMAHDGDDRRAGDEVHILVGHIEEAFLDVGLGDAPDRMAEFLGDQLRHVGVDHVGDLGHVALLHEELDHVDGAFRHAARQFLDRDGLREHHLALQLFLRLVSAETLHALRAATEGRDGPGAIFLLGRGARDGQATAVLLRTAARRPRHDEAGRRRHQRASDDGRQAAFAATGTCRACGRGTTGLAGRQPTLRFVLGLALGFGLMGATRVLLALPRFRGIALQGVARFSLGAKLCVGFGAAAVFLLTGFGTHQGTGAGLTFLFGQSPQDDARLWPARRRTGWRRSTTTGSRRSGRGAAGCPLGRAAARRGRARAHRLLGSA